MNRKIETTDKLQQSEPKTLVAVPQLATIDEMAAAIVLTKLLQKQGKSVNLYLGKTNYTLRMQKLLPAGEIKFLQKKQLAREFTVRLDVGEENEIKGVRWEQSEGQLRIYIEPSEELSDKTAIEVSQSSKFANVMLVGAGDKKQLEDFSKLQQFTNISDAQSIFVNNKDVDNARNDGDVIDTSKQSLSELIAEYAWDSSVNLDKEEVGLLLLGAHFARATAGNYTAKLDRALYKLQQKLGLELDLKDIDLDMEEYASLQSFWHTAASSTRQSNNNSDVADFLALLKLTPQFNPLIPGLGATLKNKSEGKDFLATSKMSQREVFVSDDLRIEDDTAISRRLDHFLVGYRPMRGKKQLNQPQPEKVQTKQEDKNSSKAEVATKEVAKVDREKPAEKELEKNNGRETPPLQSPSSFRIVDTDKSPDNKANNNTQSKNEESIPLRPAGKA